MDENSVYTGAWVNWTNGHILGATITVKTQYGLFLTAFLALFVRWTGAHFWAIQALLRSGASDALILMEFAQLSWVWRRSSLNPFRRTVGFMLLAGLHASAFVAAGVFSSRVAATSQDVLITSSKCGWLDDNQLVTDPGKWSRTQWAAADALYVEGRWAYQRSASFAQSCYSNSTGSPTSSSCNEFVKTFINATIDRNAACPFSEDFCLAPTIRLDSGFVDSNYDLGINTNKNERIAFRKVLQCVPIPLEEKHSTPWTKQKWKGTSSDNPIEQWKYYTFDKPVNGTQTNYTWSLSNQAGIYASQPYALDTVASKPGESDRLTFVEPLQREDADVVVILMNNFAQFSEKSLDPWFNVTRISKSGSKDLWTSYYDTSSVGCVEQFQFCNTANNVCSPLAGFLQHSVEDLSSVLSLNDNQRGVLKVVWKAVWGTPINYLLAILRGGTLLANQKTYGRWDISTALEENQWSLEIENMFNTTMAMVQRRVVEFASPPKLKAHGNQTSWDHLVKPMSPEEARICIRQKARRDGYTNFNILGLLVIIVAGAVIISMNLSLPYVVGYVQKATGRGLQKKKQWVEDGTLQLQRMAFEGRGVRPWNGRNDAVPLTAELGMLFPSLTEQKAESSPTTAYSQEKHQAYDSFHPVRHVF